MVPGGVPAVGVGKGVTPLSAVLVGVALALAGRVGVGEGLAAGVVPAKVGVGVAEGVPVSVSSMVTVGSVVSSGIAVKSPSETVMIRLFITVSGLGEMMRSTSRYQIVSVGAPLPHPSRPV